MTSQASPPDRVDVLARARRAVAKGQVDEAATVQIMADLTVVHTDRASEAVTVCRALGGQHREVGSLVAAQACFLRALALATSRPAPDMDEVASIYQELASLESTRGRHAGAETYARKAMELRTATADQRETLADQAVLAASLVAQQKHEDATPVLDKIVAASERIQGSELLETARSLAYLGALSAEHGQRGEAAALYERAISIFRAAGAPAFPALAGALHNLALLWEADGRYDDAQVLWDEAGLLVEPPSENAEGTAK